MSQQHAALADNHQVVEAKYQHYHDLFEFAPVAYVVTDANGMIREANRATTALLEQEYQFLLGKPLVFFVAEAERGRFLSGLAELREGRQVDNWAVRLQTDHRKPVEISITVAPIHDVAGNLAGFRWLLHHTARQQQVARRQKLQHVVNLALVESVNVDDVYQKLVQHIGEALEWDVGVVWCIDPSANVLRCLTLWHMSSINVTEFEIASQHTKLMLGVGLPGHVWAHREAVWVSDVTSRHSNFLRRTSAAKVGLHAAFAFPVQGSGRILAVFEFFSRDVQPPDEDLLRSISVLANQIGQFIDRLQAEDALRANESRYRMLLDQASDGILLIDPEGNYIEANAEACRMVGYSKEELQHLKVWDIVPEEDLMVAPPRFDELRQGNIVRSERRARCKDGSLLTVELSTKMLADGTIQAIVRDITERRRVELALRQSSERLTILHELDRAVLNSKGLEDIAAACLRHIHKLVPCVQASVTLFDFQAYEATVLAVYVHGEPAPESSLRISLDHFWNIKILRQSQVHKVEDLAALPQLPAGLEGLWAMGARSGITVPLLAKDELIGALNLGADSPDAFTAEQINLAREVANHLAAAIREARLLEEVLAGREQLRALSHQLIEVQENERRHLARELHDEIGQALTAVHMTLQKLTKLRKVSEFVPHLSDSMDVVERALQQVRSLALELRPSMLDDLGLVSALRWLLKQQAPRAGLTAHLIADPSDLRLPAELETTCFRVTQEALTNIIRHARARHVDVELRRQETGVQLVICDDGIGFDVRAAQERARSGETLGLLGMHERIELVGGQLLITSSKRGTEIRAHFPLG